MPIHCDITVSIPSGFEEMALNALNDMNLAPETPPHIHLTESSFSVGGVNADYVGVIGASFVDLKIPACISAYNFDDEDFENYSIECTQTPENKWVLITLTDSQKIRLDLIWEMEEQLKQCDNLMQLQAWLGEKTQNILHPEHQPDAVL